MINVANHWQKKTDKKNKQKSKQAVSPLGGIATPPIKIPKILLKPLKSPMISKRKKHSARIEKSIPHLQKPPN